MINNDTMAQKEALINEYKGNLFEYLVGAQTARLFKIEGEFLNSFGGEIKNRFSMYEGFLREHDPELITQLPLLANECALKLREYLPKNINNILVIGKSASGGGDDSFNEADLLIIENDNKLPLSLKLCKNKAFVNTKSGGIKSFISKYFSAHEKSKEWQIKLSSIVDDSFLEMGHELYEREELEFKGSFDHQWIDSGFSELPGQLNQEQTQIVLRNYYKVIRVLFSSFKEFLESNPEEFSKSLLPLLGVGNPDIIQLTCFHGEVDKKRYCLKDLHLQSYQDIKRQLNSIELKPLKDHISSFEIHLESLILQIRVKPMNKFTVPGLKVNCSIKHL